MKENRPDAKNSSAPAGATAEAGVVSPTRSKKGAQQWEV